MRGRGDDHRARARRTRRSSSASLWGSFFGDWEHRDNFLRAQLATSAGLTSAWGSEPWLLHPLALGATVGECVVLTEESSPRSHLALMGDPSLRMFVVAPPTGAVAARAGRGVSLRWSPSPEAVLGYHVYRADDPALPARRLTDRLLGGHTLHGLGAPSRPAPGTWCER